MLHSPWVNTRISVASKHDMSKIELRIIDTLHLVRCLIVLFNAGFNMPIWDKHEKKRNEQSEKYVYRYKGVHNTVHITGCSHSDRWIQTSNA